MAASASEALHLATIRHQLGLQRYEAGLVAQISALLDEADADLVAQIAGRFDTSTFSTIRLNALLDQVRLANLEAYTVLGKTLTSELRQLAGVESTWAGKAVKNAIPVRLSLTRLTAEQLRSLVVDLPMVGNTLPEEISAQSAARFKAISGTVRLGVVEGRTNAQIVQDIVGTRAQAYRDGVLQLPKDKAATLVRTATAHTANAARVEMYRANSDVIQAVMVSATLDGRTTLICAERDGTIYQLDQPFPVPPYHWNCRTTLTPVTRTLEQLGIEGENLQGGQRASKDGPVPLKMNFQEFLRAQDRKDGAFVADWFRQAFSKESLAMSALEKFRGGASLSEFVPNIRTVAQPAITIAEHAEAAGLSIEDRIALRLTDLAFSDEAQAAFAAGRELEAIDKEILALGPERDEVQKLFYRGPEGLPEARRRLDEFREKTDALRKKRAEADRLAKSLRERVNVAAHEALRQERPLDPIDFVAADSIKKDPRRLAVVTDGLQFIRDIWRGRLPERVWHPSNPEIPSARLRVEVAKRGRANMAIKIQQMNLGKHDDIGVFVHEAGHWLEKLPWVRKQTWEFYERRTAGELLKQRLRTLTGNRGYGTGELTKKDKFLNPYMGKTYSGEYTEILSMGLEMFYRDPLKLFVEDRDYFDLILRIVLAVDQ